MNEKLILRCEDSLDGVFTAIYDAFVCKNKMVQPYKDTISIAIGESSMTLFSDEHSVETNPGKVQKTVDSIQKRLGYSVYDTLLKALCHFDQERATVVLGYLVRAFAKGQKFKDHLSDPYVMRVMELARKVENERQRFYGFLRFEDTGEFLYSVIEPKCHLIPLMMEHFASRFPNENFLIYDEGRKVAAVHEAFHQCVLVQGQEFFIQEEIKDEFTALWKQYYHTMEIKERHNEKCQNNMMPKWYRKHMTEL